MSMSKVNMVLGTNITVLKAIPKNPAPQITIFLEAMNSAEKYTACVVVERAEQIASAVDSSSETKQSQSLALLQVGATLINLTLITRLDYIVNKIYSGRRII